MFETALNESYSHSALNAANLRAAASMTASLARVLERLLLLSARQLGQACPWMERQRHTIWLCAQKAEKIALRCQSSALQTPQTCARRHSNGIQTCSSATPMAPVHIMISFIIDFEACSVRFLLHLRKEKSKDLIEGKLQVAAQPSGSLTLDASRT